MSAFADTSPPPPPPIDALGNYCIYANALYSIGSGLCIGTSEFVRAPSGTDGHKDTDTGGRSYWHLGNVELAKFATPQCK